MNFALAPRPILAASVASLIFLCGCGGSPSTLGCADCPTTSGEVLYAGNSSQIQVFSIDSKTGALGTPLTLGLSRSGEMGVTPDSKFMYVTDPSNNQVDAFTIASTTGALTPLAGSPFPLNSSTRTAFGVSIDPAGKYLYVSDLYASDILGFSINGTTGSLTPVQGSPFKSGFYPAKVIISPFGFAEVVDIGPGFGGISSYVMNSASGALTPGVSGPLTYVSSAGAEDIVMHASGKYLYLSQGISSSDSGVAAFALDQTTGFPTPLSGTPFPTGLAPRSMATDSTTKFLYTANTGDGTISGFAIDATTGNLVSVPGSPFTATITPPPGGLILFQLTIEPSGHFLYATNPQNQSILVFDIASTGALTQVGSIPFAGQAAGLLAIKLP